MDFEFNLDDIDIDPSNNGYDNFSFEPNNQTGGSSAVQPIETKLPGEELLEAPDESGNDGNAGNADNADNADNVDDIPEKIEVELIGNNAPNDEEAIVDPGKIHPQTREDRAEIDFDALISDAQTDAPEGVISDPDLFKMEAEIEYGSSAPVIIENEVDEPPGDMDTLDSYVDRLKIGLNIEDPIESVFGTRCISPIPEFYVLLLRVSQLTLEISQP